MATARTATGMITVADADRAARRAQVVEALADAAATLDHPPVHVAVDGTGGGTARALADDLGRALAVLLPHLPDPGSGLAALAARHGRRLRHDDLLAPASLDRLLRRTGWSLDGYEDGPDRFLAGAHRIRGPGGGR